jgi:hypothetical protein
MAKIKKELSPAQKAAKKKSQQEYMTIFVNGKQKRVKRPVRTGVRTGSGHGNECKSMGKFVKWRPFCGLNRHF